MKTLRYTLLADGSSDRALIPIINWLLNQHAAVPFEPQFPKRIPSHGLGLKLRIEQVLDLYPCDVLFVHRDGEGESFDVRSREIADNIPDFAPESIHVIPIRMTEAWLLTSVPAIRFAADNPSGQVELRLPARDRLENLPDPKRDLSTLLSVASELHGRRLDKFNSIRRIPRVAELTDDFSALRDLGAFRRLEQRLLDVLARLDAGAAGPAVA